MSVRSLTPVQHYEKLEKLLLAENGRIAHAMFVSVSPTSAEKVRLSLPSKPPLARSRAITVEGRLRLMIA
jgi:hypothetical protein